MAAGLLAAVALAVYYLAGERLVARATRTRSSASPSEPPRASGRSCSRGGASRSTPSTADVTLPGALVGATVPVWALALWTIAFGTIAPFVLSVGALQHLPATTVTIVATFEPVAAAFVAWVWLGETLIAVQILGGAVVLAGIVLAETSR